jgi:crossover junction endodeoxyribonuclease RuvC
MLNHSCSKTPRENLGTGGYLLSRRVLGVDPGLQITGYGVIEPGAHNLVVCEAGIIRSNEGSAAADMAERLRSLYDGLLGVIDQFQPRAVAVEQLYAHYQHPRTAILMGHARGVIFLAAAQRDLPVVSYNATRIKKTITGSGRASKDQVQRAIQRELGLAKVPQPPDVADALAVALCHYYVQKLKPGPLGTGLGHRARKV